MTPATFDLQNCNVFLAPQDWAELVRILRLSPREIELLEAILVDLKDSAIAAKLGISVHTVRTHFERLFRKLDVRSRAGVIATAFETFYRLRVQHRSAGM